MRQEISDNDDCRYFAVRFWLADKVFLPSSKFQKRTYFFVCHSQQRLTVSPFCVGHRLLE
jgi:hypothetical protein